MQQVSEYWEQVNRSFFTPKASVSVTIQRADGKAPFITGTDLISFSHVKSGDLLSGSLTQDKIIFTARNRNGFLSYDAENDSEVYENALCVVQEGFMNADSSAYDSIDGGRYYISEVKQLQNGQQYQFTAQSVLGFMTEKAKTPISETYNARAMVIAVMEQAIASQGVPIPSTKTVYEVLECDLDALAEIGVEYIENTDNYSLAEILQLIAAMSGNLLYVDRTGVIHIEPHGTVTEHYVLSKKVLYKQADIEYAARIGNVTVQANHGQFVIGTDYEGDKIGGLQVVTIPILDDETAASDLCDYVYDKLTNGRKHFKATCRFDPALDLFDVIAVPFQDVVFPAIVTSINASFNGAWKADIQAVALKPSDITLDLRICDIEMLTIEQFEHLRINQLVPDE